MCVPPPPESSPQAAPTTNGSPSNAPPPPASPAKQGATPWYEEDTWIFGLGSDCASPPAPDRPFPNLTCVLIVDDGEVRDSAFLGEVLDLPNLQALYLNGPRLLPQAEKFLRRCRNPNLRELAFAGCGLTQIPEWVMDHKELEKLLFCHEPITTLPPELFDLVNLKSLDFQHIPLTSLPDDIRKLVRLERFDLWTVDSDLELDYLSPELFRLPNLQTANLAWSRFKSTPELAQAMESFATRERERLRQSRALPASSVAPTAPSTLLPP